MRATTRPQAQRDWRAVRVEHTVVQVRWWAGWSPDLEDVVEVKGKAHAPDYNGWSRCGALRSEQLVLRSQLDPSVVDCRRCYPAAR